VTFTNTQLTQASFLQKIKRCKMLFHSCNAEMAQNLSSLQKSEFLNLIILIPDFFRSNSFIFEQKVEKIYMGVFSTHFVPLISILAPKIMEE
jgi:hypothetical protein